MFIVHSYVTLIEYFIVFPVVLKTIIHYPAQPASVSPLIDDTGRGTWSKFPVSPPQLGLALRRGDTPRCWDGTSHPLSCDKDRPGQQQRHRCPPGEQRSAAIASTQWNRPDWGHLIAREGQVEVRSKQPRCCASHCTQLLHQRHLPLIHLTGSNSPKKHLFGQQNRLPTLPIHPELAHPLSCPEPSRCPPACRPLRDVHRWQLIAVPLFFCCKPAPFAGGEASLLCVSPDRLSTVVKRGGIKEKELKQPRSEGPVIYLLPPMNAGCKSLCIKITPFSNF